MLKDTQRGTSPQLTSAPSSPLDALALRALRRYGEMAASTVEGDAMLLFLDYGNEIVDDILGHPYCPPGLDLPYFEHPSDQRHIPDHILIAGLVARHAEQQKSQVAGDRWTRYHQTLNQVMARVQFGTGATFEITAPDRPIPPPPSETA